MHVAEKYPAKNSGAMTNDDPPIEEYSSSSSN